MSEMFGTEFVAFAIIIFAVLAIIVRRGMLDPVIRSHGTQISSVKTKAWMLTLTVIFVGIIMGVSLLVEFLW